MASDRSPLEAVIVAEAAADAVRKAHAVGLADETPDFAELTYQTVRKVVLQVREAGVGYRAASAVLQAPPSDTDAIARGLRELDALIEESPFPDTEWPRLLEVLDRDRLAALVDISPSSAGRYERGERRTPDEVAARLHFLALVVGDLAGAYNALGIRRWFDRPRTALDGKAPAALLRAGWQPDEAGPLRVRDLARAIVTSPAT